MNIVTLHLKAPSSRKADIIGLVDSFIGPVSVQTGCLTAKFYTSEDNELLLIEEWKSELDLQNHIRSEEFRKVLALMDLAESKPRIRFFTVNSVQGLEYVARLRRKEAKLL